MNPNTTRASMVAAALFDSTWLSLLSGPADSAAENDSVCAKGGGFVLSAPTAATKTETVQIKSDESNKAIAKLEVKAERR